MPSPADNIPLAAVIKRMAQKLASTPNFFLANPEDGTPNVKMSAKIQNTSLSYNSDCY
jgi:hypothetical protein